jgi:hypothetical protein
MYVLPLEQIGYYGWLRKSITSRDSMYIPVNADCIVIGCINYYFFHNLK